MPVTCEFGIEADGLDFVPEDFEAFVSKLSESLCADCSFGRDMVADIYCKARLYTSDDREKHLILGHCLSEALEKKFSGINMMTNGECLKIVESIKAS